MAEKVPAAAGDGRGTVVGVVRENVVDDITADSAAQALDLLRLRLAMAIERGDDKTASRLRMAMAIERLGARLEPTIARAEGRAP